MVEETPHRKTLWDLAESSRNVVKDRAEILKHTTMLNGILAAAWRVRHEILKLDIARLSERYHKTAWSLVRHAYFKILGNRQLVDTIFNDLIKVAMENATFWENMQTTPWTYSQTKTGKTFLLH